jgi:hypothetical protein
MNPLFSAAISVRWVSQKLFASVGGPTGHAVSPVVAGADSRLRVDLILHVTLGGLAVLV